MTADPDATGTNPAEPGLSCRELVEIVTDYLEGALPTEERARVHAHLSECPGCSTYVEQMRETIALTGRLRGDDVPEPVRQALLRAFRESNAQR